MKILFLDLEKTGYQCTADIKINVKRKTKDSFKYTVFKLLLTSLLCLNGTFTLQQACTVRNKHQPYKQSLWEEPQTRYFSLWTVMPVVMENKLTFLLHLQVKEKAHNRNMLWKMDSPYKTLSTTGCFISASQIPWLFAKSPVAYQH